MDDAVGTEAGASAEDGGAGQAKLADFLDDGLVQRLAFKAVGFADVNAEEHAIAAATTRSCVGGASVKPVFVS